MSGLNPAQAAALAYELQKEALALENAAAEKRLEAEQVLREEPKLQEQVMAFLGEELRTHAAKVQAQDLVHLLHRMQAHEALVLEKTARPQQILPIPTAGVWTRSTKTSPSRSGTTSCSSRMAIPPTTTCATPTLLSSLGVREARGSKPSSSR